MPTAHSPTFGALGLVSRSCADAYSSANTSHGIVLSPAWLFVSEIGMIQMQLFRQVHKMYSRNHSLPSSFVKAKGSQVELKQSYRYMLAENALIRLVPLMFYNDYCMLMIISYTTKQIKT